MKQERCNCEVCEFKGMALCDYKKCLDVIAALRVALMTTNHMLGDVAASINSADMRKTIIDVAKMNYRVLAKSNKAFLELSK